MCKYVNNILPPVIMYMNTTNSDIHKYKDNIIMLLHANKSNINIIKIKRLC